MPRESQAAKRERLGEIIAGLQRTYPDAHCELNYRNPLQLMVATILSAQCTDKQVNIVTKDLFKKYKKVADFAAVPLEELQNDIRRIGLFRNKAKSIQNGRPLYPANGQIAEGKAEAEAQRNFKNFQTRLSSIRHESMSLAEKRARGDSNTQPTGSKPVALSN